MRRRLAALMAASIFALAFSASPTLASGRDGGHGDHWIVVDRTATDLTSYPAPVLAWMLDCSTAHRASTYTLLSGFVDQVEMYKGSFEGPGNAGLATTPGRGIETWTLRDVKVQSDQTGRIYRAVGSSTVDVTWSNGATYGAGPFTRGSFVQDVRVKGTRDGRSFVQALDVTSQSLVLTSEHGSCSNLQIGMQF